MILFWELWNLDNRCGGLHLVIIETKLSLLCKDKVLTCYHTENSPATGLATGAGFAFADDRVVGALTEGSAVKQETKELKQYMHIFT